MAKFVNSLQRIVQGRYGALLQPGDPGYEETLLNDESEIRPDKAVRPRLDLKIRSWEPGPERILPTGSTTEHFWTPIHHDLIRSDAFSSLSLSELQVLLHLMKEFDGTNNGKLTATLKGLQKTFRWGDSPDTLKRALIVLTSDKRKLIVQEKPRSGAQPALYSLTWLKNRIRKKSR